MKNTFISPSEAIRELTHHLQTLNDSESQIVSRELYGRVLSEPIIADRDSPAANVSAMDGFALNLRDLKPQQPITIVGECKAGSPPPRLLSGAAVRIFTGAMIPDNANAVIKREDVIEVNDTISIQHAADHFFEGINIRRAGENATAGSEIIEKGTILNAAHAAAITNFGHTSIAVKRTLRISIITTGDEVGDFQDSTPQLWQIRNSNRRSLCVLLDAFPWIEISSEQHCVDSKQAIQSMITQSLDTADVVLLTGGVSVGDHDHVPEVVETLGANLIFHGLPIRPGKPILGAATNTGKLILGLPGNPVSAMIGCFRIGIPLMKYMAGAKHWNQTPPSVRVENSDEKTIPLHWFRLVRQSSDGNISLCDNKGSGDLVALGQSSGFVELLPNQVSDEALPYYSWN